jgi:hypothetical protein
MSGKLFIVIAVVAGLASCTGSSLPAADLTMDASDFAFGQPDLPFRRPTRDVDDPEFGCSGARFCD